MLFLHIAKILMQIVANGGANWCLYVATDFVTRGFIIAIWRDKWRRKCANNGGAKCV